MNRLFMIAAISGAVLTLSRPTPAGETPYAGQEQREVKALSEDEMQGYLEGRGMGLAKAAELNHYPGPRHVLDLAEELGLTGKQLQRTKELYEEMHADALRIGKLIVDNEKVLDGLFAGGTVDDKSLSSLVAETGRLRGKLRYVHLRAHLGMKEVLTPEQVTKYDMLRGYAAGGHHEGHH